MKQSTGSINSTVAVGNVAHNNTEISAPTGKKGEKGPRFSWDVNSWLSVIAIVLSVIAIGLAACGVSPRVFPSELLVSALSIITTVLLVKQLADYFSTRKSLNSRLAQIDAELLTAKNASYDLAALSELITLCVSIETNNAPLRWGELDNRLSRLISCVRFLKSHHPDVLLACVDILSRAIGRLSAVCDFSGVEGVADYGEYIRKNQKNINELIALRDELPPYQPLKSDTSSN